MYIISDEQWARESNGQIRQLRLLVIEVSYKLLKQWFSCPDVAPPPPVSLDGPSANHQHQPPPIPSFRDFIFNAVTRTRTPLNAMVAAVYLVRRLKERNSNCAGTSITPHRVMLAAIMLACKLLYDDTYSNRTWVHVSQGIFSLEEINRMEWEFLSYIKFEAAITREEWVEHVIELDMQVAHEEHHDSSMTTLQRELNLNVASIEADTRIMSLDEIASVSQLSLHQLQQIHQLPVHPQPQLLSQQPNQAHGPAVSQSQSQSRMAGGMASSVSSSSSSAEDVSLPSAAEHGTLAAGNGSTRVTRSLSRKKSAAAASASGSSLSSSASRPTSSFQQPQAHSAKVMPSMPSVAIADPVPRPNSAAAALVAHRSSSSTSSLPCNGASAPPAASWHQGSHSHGSLPTATHQHHHQHVSHSHHHGHAPSVSGQPSSSGQQHVHSAPYPPVSQHHRPMYPPPSYPSSNSQAMGGGSSGSSSRTPMPSSSSSGSQGSSNHHHLAPAPPPSGQHYNTSRPYTMASIPPHHALHGHSAQTGSSSGSGPVVPPPLKPGQQGTWYPPPAWPTHSYSVQHQAHPSQAQQHHLSSVPPPHVPTSSSFVQHDYVHPQPPAQMQPAHLVPPPPPSMPMSSTSAPRDVVPALVRARTGSNPATVGMPAGAPLSASQQQHQAAMLVAAAAAAAAGQLNKRGDSGTDLHALQQLHGLTGASAAVAAAQHAQYMHHHRGPAVSGTLGGGMMSVTVGGGNGPSSGSGPTHGMGSGSIGSNGFGQ